MSKHLFKSTAIVGSMTMISRVTGFVRDMLIANIFGVSIATDAFFVAFKIPNFLRRLFAEGAFAHAFVPVLADYKNKNDREELKSFIGKTAGTLAFVQLGISIVGIIVAPALIFIFAPGFFEHAGQFQLAVRLLQITFPYLLFISLTAFAGGILNAHGQFAVPAITPVFMNLAMIIAAVWISPYMALPIMALAWGVFFAGLLQLLFQIPALLQLGLLPRMHWGWHDPGVRRIIRLMLPAIFGVSVVQVNLLIDTFFTSFLPSGSVSWLYYSDRLVEFPLGIFGVAVGTVILPSLSKSHAQMDMQAFSTALDWGLKLVVLIGLPATLGLTLLAEPILSTMFQYHEFGTDDVQMAGKSLAAFAVGLLAFILIKVLVPGFTSRKDIGVPVRFGIYSIVSNLVLNVVLIFPLAHAGPAFATTLSAYLNAGLLLRSLLVEKIYRPCRQWRLFFMRTLLATEVMSVYLYEFTDSASWQNWHALQRGERLLLMIVSAFLVYVLALLVSGVRPKHVFESYPPAT